MVDTPLPGPSNDPLAGVKLREEVWDEGGLVSFTDDRTLSEAKTALIAAIKHRAGRELKKTDWYATRKLEIGTEIPPDVTTVRTRIRQRTTSLANAVIAATTLDELDAISWGSDLGDNEGGPDAPGPGPGP